MKGIITLTSDFGLEDHYVSAMKAVILGIAPEVRLVDVSHQVPPQDIMAGAWITTNSAPLYPPGTVHLVVIDPGVGTERKPMALKVGEQYFVGPDNGLFSLLIDEAEDYRAVELSNPEYHRTNGSSTFHGRDIFAPVAAHLSQGVSLEELGEPINDLVKYRWAMPVADPDGLQGWVVHIDRYGNLITNLRRDLIEKNVGEQQVKIYVGNTILDEIKTTFGDVPEGDPVAYIGSSETLEVAINKGNAATMLGVKKGAPVSVVVQK